MSSGAESEVSLAVRYCELLEADDNKCRDGLTSAVDSSGFSVLGRPLLFEPSSLSSDKDSALRFRLRGALAGAGLAFIVNRWRG